MPKPKVAGKRFRITLLLLSALNVGKIKFGLLLVAVQVLAFGPLALAQDEERRVSPLLRAHAHNDYEHPRPLLDALDHGFCSVEADIFLVNGALLVAHDQDKVNENRTLQRLYLDPLRERAKKNGGRIYPGGPPFILLIDLKSECDPTYAALREVLAQYPELFTSFSNNRIEQRAVTAIVSGVERPRAMMKMEATRFAAMDGRLEDLDGREPKELIPLISDNWKKHFQWAGEGPFPEEERRRLKGLVDQAHRQRRLIRFWAAPDRIEVWRELHAAGVDLINTDDLSGLRDFLSGR